MKRIHKVAVLGAGTMGARIAGHFANAGVPALLLDMVPPDADGTARNKIAAAGLEAARKSKPAAFYEPSLARLVTIGNFEDDLKRLADVDWIVEAVVENLEIKRSLLKKVEAIRKPGTIVTTNTSGLPVAKIAEGFSEDFRRSWFGTHFFNPPRYMRLLELIPTPDADRRLMEAVTHFCDTQLGKGVVLAKDTPNFIANRIGTFSVLNVMRLMQEMDMSVEEVDALTGQALGWPRSATFRTIDMVGLDILGHVVSNMTGAGVGQAIDERSDLKLPESYRQMLERKFLGDKTKQGFYNKVKGEGAEDERLALDWKTLEYRPRRKPKFAALEIAKNVEATGARVRMLLGLDGSSPQKGDQSGAFLWAALSDLWAYSANRIPEISDSVVEIDRAMHLGFNWELGPFQLWDAAGVEATVRRMKKEGRPIAANVEQLHRQLRPQVLGFVHGRLEACRCPAGRVVRRGREKIERSGQEECRSFARRSGRGCGRHRVSLEDECHRGGHRLADHANLEARRSGGQLRRLRDHQRRAEFFCGCEPDAPADVCPGRRMG